MHGRGGRVGGLHGVDQAQEQVVVLRAVTFAALAAGLLVQRLFEHGQVADIVAGHQVFRRIVRLEVRDMGALRRFAEQRFVAVQESRAGGGRRPAHLVHGVRGQQVVVVGQRQVGPGGQRRGGVGVGGDAFVFDLAVDDAGVGRRARLCQLAHAGVGGVGGVGKHKLPARAGLGLDAVEEGVQERFRGVVQRRQDADEREGGRIRRALGRQRAFGRPVPRAFAQQPPPEKARRAPQHGGQALFAGQRAGIAEQFLDSFGLQVHSVRPSCTGRSTEG